MQRHDMKNGDTVQFGTPPQIGTITRIFVVPHTGVKRVAVRTSDGKIIIMDYDICTLFDADIRIELAMTYVMEPDVTFRVVSINGVVVYEIEHVPDGNTRVDLYTTPSAIPCVWHRHVMYALVNNMHDCNGYWECAP